MYIYGSGLRSYLLAAVVPSKSKAPCPSRPLLQPFSLGNLSTATYEPPVALACCINCAQQAWKRGSVTQLQMLVCLTDLPWTKVTLETTPDFSGQGGL